jgi:peroxiredoxin
MKKKIVFGLLLGILYSSLGASLLFSATTEGKEGLLVLGSKAPPFTLPDAVSGESVSRDDFQEKKALLVMFICRHCPYVQRVKEGIAQLAHDYAGKEVAFVAISSNDPEAFPADRPESLKEMSAEAGFTFPFLFDETQKVGLAYTAVATPDFFLFDQERRLVYRGQLDEARPGNDVPVTGQDVRAALDAVLNDQPVPKDQKPSIGCSIKWKPGNEPTYL